MKTRIKETTKTEDGIVKVVYQAQFFDFWKWCGWKPILDYHLWQLEGGWVLYSDVKPLETPHERGTIEFCKDVINYVLKLEKEDREYDEKLKQVKKSAKVKYIRYP